jgi:hypothetical protein
MRGKVSTWISALFSLSVFVRCVFYFGLKLYSGEQIPGVDMAVVIVIGLGSLYFTCAFFKTIFSRGESRSSQKS